MWGERGGQMREMRRNFRIEWIRDTINRKWTRMFVLSYCIIKSSLNNFEQAVMPHQGIKLQPFHRPLIGHMWGLRPLIGRWCGPVHGSCDEVFMIISSMTMTEKLGKNFSSHPRARDESFQRLPSPHWFVFCRKVQQLAEVFTALSQWPRLEARALRHLTTSSVLTVNEKFSMFCRLWCQNIHRKTLKKIFPMPRHCKRETGNWRNESLFMTRGSGSAGWSPWSRHTDISLTDISHPGARAWIILTGAGALQGSWLSTVNYKPRKGHVSFQFVTSILRRKQ